MALSKKEKKEARRQRQEERHSRERIIQARLASAEGSAEAGAETVYVPPGDPAPPPPPPLGDGETAAEKADQDEDEDRVELPAAPAASAPAPRPHAARRGAKVSWEALKLAVASRYGQEMSAVVEEHDGNAADPLFTVALKTVRGSVPVPRHWGQLRAYLTTQTDRERTADLVPPEIAALGVERIRATRDRRANPDQVAFVACFITGTPLRRKRFRAALSRFGEVFHEGRWTPHTQYEPGRLSSGLRTALAMGPHAPPPWLYGMQAMRRLPPAYPSLRVPGLNAPIPPGAQWGNGEGQWGQPPRNEHNTFLFPGVMDEAAVAADEAPPAHWGSVPPLGHTQTAAQSPTQQQRPPPPQQQVSKPAQGPAKNAPVVAPVPFHPQAYAPAAAMRYVPTTPQEYVRVQDNTAGATVALGSVLVPKAPVGPPEAQPNKQPQSPSPRQFTNS